MAAGIVNQFFEKKVDAIRRLFDDFLSAKVCFVLFYAYLCARFVKMDKQHFY